MRGARSAWRFARVAIVATGIAVDLVRTLRDGQMSENLADGIAGQRMVVEAAPVARSAIGSEFRQALRITVPRKMPNGEKGSFQPLPRRSLSMHPFRSTVSSSTVKPSTPAVSVVVKHLRGCVLNFFGVSTSATAVAADRSGKR